METRLLINAKEVMMDKFIECVCHRNYAVLVIEGTATEEEIVEAWIKVKSQYMQLLKSAQADVKIEQVNETTEYHLKKVTVEYLLVILYMGYDQDIIEQLQEEGYDYPFTEETYLEDIEKVIAELGSEGIPISLYQENIEAAMEESPQEDMYYESIAILQKSFGLCSGQSPMQAARSLSVYEFALFCNKHNQLKPKKETEEDE